MPSLWTNPDFRRLWAGQTASQLGEHTSLVIIPLVAVLTLGVAADQLGVLRAVGQAPFLLVALFAGALVDRWRTRTVMVLADLGRALALGAVALVGGLTLPVLLVVAFVVGSLSVLFDVAYQASLPRMLRPDQLLHGNSAVEGSRSAAQISGPALGGTLTSLLSAPIAAASSALFFVVSFVSIARIDHRETIPPRSDGALRFVARHGLLRTICLASAAFQFSLSALMTAYLVFLPRELHLSGAIIGLVLAGIGPGALIGSLLAARLPARFGYGPVVIAAALLGNGAMLCVPALRGSGPATIGVLVAANLVFGALGQMVNVSLMALRQIVSPAAMQGRITATITFAGMGVTPIGSLLGGIAAEHWGLRTALLAAALGMMVSPLVMALSRDLFRVEDRQ